MLPPAQYFFLLRRTSYAPLDDSPPPQVGPAEPGALERGARAPAGALVRAAAPAPHRKPGAVHVPRGAAEGGGLGVRGRSFYKGRENLSTLICLKFVYIQSIGTSISYIDSP